MIPTFKLEEYLGRHEFSAPYLLCCSDAESFSVNEILSMASPEELKLWENLRLGYTEVPGMPLLRETIAKQLYQSLAADNILCFAGAEEGIYCALTALAEPSEHMIVVTPCYQSLLEIPRYRGCTITEVPLKEENGWCLDIEEIKRAIQPNTKWVVMNFPHNPTGQILREDELDELIRLLDKHGIYLFSDEAYRLLGENGVKWAPAAACNYPRALSLGVMSKAYGMAGLRIGWIACQDKEILTKLSHMKHYTSICNSALSEIISLIALRNSEKILQRNRGIVTANLSVLNAFFEKHSNLFSWIRPSGGCVGFVRYHGSHSVEELCDYVRKNEDVLLLPGTVYDVQTPHFRIGFGRANMGEALAKFEKAISILS